MPVAVALVVKVLRCNITLINRESKRMDANYVAALRSYQRVFLFDLGYESCWTLISFICVHSRKIRIHSRMRV